MSMNGTIRLPPGFTAWDGPMFKDSPYPPNVTAATVVETVNRSGIWRTATAGEINWSHHYKIMRNQIVGYRIVEN